MTTTVKEHELLMNAAMVRATLAGTKTQTRRLITPRNSTVLGYGVTAKSKLWQELDWSIVYPQAGGPHMLHPSETEYLRVAVKHDPMEDGPNANDRRQYRVRPRYEVGDRLWVRETCCIASGPVGRDKGIVHYRATADSETVQVANEHRIWTPSIHMPRWASRITLEITGVRVERLQAISEADKAAEGGTPEVPFGTVWRKINTTPGIRWEDNPWVWVLEFKRVSQ